METREPRTQDAEINESSRKDTSSSLSILFEGIRNCGIDPKQK
jgi:hypothetical protein